MSARFEPAQVRSYYDRHTEAFVTYGQGGDEGAIHRAVWGPGVITRDQAFHFIDDRVVACVEELPEGGQGAHVVDLGCGVGASLCYVAKRVPIRGTGVTISPVQASEATRRIREARLDDRVRCLEADFSELPPTVPPADLAFAIESFVHGPHPAAFFAACHRLLRPGGRLLICDDFRRPSEDPKAPAAIERFCRGWHINTLVLPSELERLAADAGFQREHVEELGTHLELGRPRDRLIELAVAGLGWIPAFASRYDHLVGGAALQTCLTRGWVGYDLVTFRRNGA